MDFELKKLLQSADPLCVRETIEVIVVRFFVFTTLLVGSTLLTACGNLEGTITRGNPKLKEHDFERTEMIHNGAAFADGVSELLVVVQLKNSDNQPVANYKPAYEVASGAAVITSPCTTSLDTGISVCILKSTQPGAKKIRLINAKE